MECPGAWISPDFDDQSWIKARGGFVGGSTMLSQATRIPNFGQTTQTSLFRHTFAVENVDAIRSLVLRLQYNTDYYFGSMGTVSE